MQPKHALLLGLLADDHAQYYNEARLAAYLAANPADHGGLLGLADDDHTQYHTDARALTWLGTRNTDDLSEGAANLYFLDARAVSAMGAIGDGNPLHHNRYTDAEAAAKILADDDYVQIAGDTMTGSLTVQGLIRAAAGSVTDPSITFDGDPNTGLSNPVADRIAFSTNGVERMHLGTTHLNFNAGATGSPAIRNNAVSSETLPGFTFVGDTNTGLYRIAADQLGITVGGAQRQAIFTTAHVFGGTGTTGHARIEHAAGSLTAVTYSFHNDNNTGLLRSAADTLQLVTGGIARLTINNTTLDAPSGVNASLHGTSGFYTYRNSPSVGSGGTAIWFNNGGTEELRETSSTKRVKKWIKDAPPHLADVPLLPKQFQLRQTNQILFGFLAEDFVLPELDPDERLIRRDNKGRVKDFDDRGLMAVFAAKINRLEQLIAA